MIDEFEPNWCTPPGATITELLEEHDMEIIIFAHRMGCSIDYVSSLLQGDRMLTDKDATRLAKIFGPSEEFWMRREKHFRDGLISEKRIIV
jgi:HTH-type transcriptional regulator/antitoxin HigA